MHPATPQEEDEEEDEDVDETAYLEMPLFDDDLDPEEIEVEIDLDLDDEEQTGELEPDEIIAAQEEEIPDLDDYVAVLTQLPIFKGLSDDGLKGIASLLSPVPLGVGDMLHDEGEEADRLCLVIKGMLAEKKRGKFVRYVQTRRPTAVQVVLGARSRDSSSTAVRPTLLWAIDGAELRARMERDGDLRELLYRNAAVDLAEQLATRK